MRLLPNRPLSAPGVSRRHPSVGMARPGAVDAAVGSRFRGNDEEMGGGNDEPGNCVNEGPGDGGLTEIGQLRRPGG